MQNDFVLEGAPFRVAQARAVVPKIREVLEVFRERNLPVIHILRVHRKTAPMSNSSGRICSRNIRLPLRERTVRR